MPFGKSPEEIWGAILKALKFGAQFPVAALIIAAAAFGSFLALIFMFIITEWLWIHWLSQPLG